jgi:hypothetical protein
MRIRTCLTTEALFILAVAFHTICTAQQGDKAGTGRISVITVRNPSPAVRIAADELAGYLGKIYPKERFVVVPGDPSRGRNIFIGTTGDLAMLRPGAKPVLPTAPEGYVVTPIKRGDLHDLFIVGADDLGVLHGVYGLLEKLGCGFYMSFETLPQPRRTHADFASWKLSDAPLVPERLIFNWHNFLTGCSGWDKKDWLNWIRQSQKMGFNTVMAHAYGNNPIFTFEFKGKIKLVGYLPHSGKGREWSNTTVNDVRRLPSGDAIADGPYFGSEAALVPDDRRVSAIQTMMREVYQAAADRGMRVDFAFDFDSPAGVPQELVMALPESDRFKNGELWLPRPDTAGGYAFYKAELVGLLQLYPQITGITLWNNDALWRLDTEQFPPEWRAEFNAMVSRVPRLRELGQQGSSYFAIAKLVAAYRRALQELGHSDIRISCGGWFHAKFDWIEAAVLALPDDIRILPLDYSVLTGESLLLKEENLQRLRGLSRGRVVPVIWAQHDDGGYMGRPVAMMPDLQSRLEKVHAPGFGIIHWMNRPYDIFFKSHGRQVWQRSRDESLVVTARRMAADCFGDANRELLGEYLRLWATEAPCTGRATQETFYFHGWNEGISDAPKLVRLGRERIAMLDCANIPAMNAAQKRWLKYFHAFENFLIRFCEEQERVQRANQLIVDRKHAEAATILASLKPEEVIADYARMVHLMPDDKGQRAMILRLGCAWWGDIVCLRQMAGLEPVRYAFGPTFAEPLAEGSAFYNDFVDRGGQLWRLLGEYELLQAPLGYHCSFLPPSDPGRIRIRTIPASITVRPSSKIPKTWREIARNGFIPRQPIKIPLRAINKGFPYSYTHGELRSGRYTLTVLAARPTPGDRPCTATLRITPSAVEEHESRKPRDQIVPVANKEGTPRRVAIQPSARADGNHAVVRAFELPPDKQTGVVTVYALEISIELNEGGNATLEIVPGEGEMVFSGVVLAFVSDPVQSPGAALP